MLQITMQLPIRTKALYQSRSKFTPSNQLSSIYYWQKLLRTYSVCLQEHMILHKKTRRRCYHCCRSAGVKQSVPSRLRHDISYGQFEQKLW